jgi:hypothetical protein
VILTAVRIACQDDRVDIHECRKQKSSNQARLSQPLVSARKDTDGDKAIVEISSTRAILAAERISADN